MATLQQAEVLLTNGVRFWTDTLRGEWETTGYPTPETFTEAYVVRSYGVEIARANFRDGELVSAILNTQKYSKTTSRHLNIVKRAWGLN